MTEYISVTQFAKEAKIARQSVLARIKRGTLKAKKVGNFYVIERTHRYGNFEQTK